MFIPESEADRRISSDENLTNLISGEETLPVLEAPLPPELDLSDLDAIIGISPDSISKPKNFDRTLEKLLNPDGYAGLGRKNLHRDTQAAIGTTAGILGTTRASRLGGVAISQAHSYERGYTGPVDLVNPAKSPKEELQNKIIEGHGIVVDLAFNRLLQTLELLDDDKLASVKKAGELSVIAKNLSGVISHASQATKETNFDSREQSVHFHIMKPERALESEYQTVEISSEKEEKSYQDFSRDR